MTPTEAINILDQIAEKIPMVDNDDAVISYSLSQLMSSVVGTSKVEPQVLQESLTRLSHMAKSVPLVRQSRALVREAIGVLGSYVESVALVEDEPQENLDSQLPKPKRRRRS